MWFITRLILTNSNWKPPIKRIGTKIHWAFCSNWRLNSIDYINLIFNDIQHQIWLRIWICWKDLIINQVPEEKINHPNLIIRCLGQKCPLKSMQYFQLRSKLLISNQICAFQKPILALFDFVVKKLVSILQCTLDLVTLLGSAKTVTKSHNVTKLSLILWSKL